MSITFRLNGVTRTLDVDHEMRLSEILRDHLALTATKIACGIGRCGACMVLMNGKPVNSCLVMAWQLSGADIVTGEGLEALAHARIIREALIAENAFQCGYCAPGFAIMLTALLGTNPDAGETEIRAGLEGNLCRCTGYHSILRGALSAAAALRDARASGDLP
jgi:carbon-monoxide dehydrogenase small subunit